MDRPLDDHFRERQQGTGTCLPRIHDPGKDAKTRHRSHPLHSGQSWRVAVSHSERDEGPAPGQSRRVHAAHLFLAGCSSPREVQRNLKRGQSRAVSSAAANSRAPDAISRGVLLEVRGVAKRFGSREVLKNISLNIAPGEFLTLLGESGSGKTTLLRLIAGFEQPTD